MILNYLTRSGKTGQIAIFENKKFVMGIKVLDLEL